MPTYKNNTLVDQNLTVKNDTLGVIKPGVTLNTKFFSTNAALTLVSETPYYNRLAAVEKVSALSGTPQTVVIRPDTEKIVITQITGLVTVYSQAVANTPPLFLDWESVSPIIPITNDGTFNKLLLIGSGDCTVYQYR